MVAYELLGRWLPVFFLAYGAVVFLYVPAFWRGLAGERPRAERTAAGGFLIGVLALLLSYCLLGSGGPWADRYAIVDLTAPHEYISLGACWEALWLAVGLAICLRVVSGKFRREWRSLLYRPEARWPRRLSVAFASVVVAAVAFYHLDPDLAPLRLVQDRAANLLSVLSSDSLDDRRKEESRQRYPFDSRPETLQRFAAAERLNEMTEALVLAGAPQPSAEQLKAEEDFLALMGQEDDQPEESRKKLAKPRPEEDPAGANEAQRRQEFWHAFVRHAALPYAVYMPYSMIALAAVAVPLACVAVYGAVLDLRLTRRRFLTLTNGIRGADGEAEVERLLGRFSDHLSRMGGKYCELPLYAAVLLAMECLVRQAAIAAAARVLAVMAALAVAAIVGELAAIGAVYAAAFRRASGRFADRDHRPQFLESRAPARYLKRLRKETGLTLAAWLAGASLVAAFAMALIGKAIVH